MPKKTHEHSSHRRSSSLQEGFIANEFKNTMNKNEKLILGILVGGIIIFLCLSIILLYTKGKEQGFTPGPLALPTKSPNATPYPTIPPVTDMTVMLNERLFNPDSVTINRGYSVDFLNIGENPITIEANDENSKALNIGTIAPSEDKMVTFEKPGTYTYRNKNKPTMIGIIIIK